MFNLSMLWLKYATLLCIAYCLFMAVIISFDPLYILEDNLVNDLYGSSKMPFEAIPIYDFFFLLLSWASVCFFALQYGLIHYGIAQKQKWAYNFLSLGVVLWVGGGIAITALQQAYSYFYFLGVLSLLFLLPLVSLRKYIYVKM